MIEKDLFEYLKDKYFPDLKKSLNPYSRWDCHTATYGYRIELKCRKTHYPTLLIEEKKYNSMLESVKGTSDIPLYINSTPEGVFSFNLHSIKPTFEVNYKNPKTTMWGGGRVPKSVGYLPITLAKKC
jgi:hypothetical protein